MPNVFSIIVLNLGLWGNLNIALLSYSFAELFDSLFLKVIPTKTPANFFWIPSLTLDEILLLETWFQMGLHSGSLSG